MCVTISTGVLQRVVVTNRLCAKHRRSRFVAVNQLRSKPLYTLLMDLQDLTWLPIASVRRQGCQWVTTRFVCRMYSWCVLADCR